MKRKLIITVICLFSSIFITLLIYYCYIQYQLYKHDWVVSEVELVDSTRIYRIGELLEMSDGDLKKVKRLSMISYADRPSYAKDYDYDTFPPIVSQLINLEYLDFSYNAISDLTPFKHLTHLKEMLLSGNKISDLKDFENFPNLTYLDIGYNPLSDLKGIEKSTISKFIWQ